MSIIWVSLRYVSLSFLALELFNVSFLSFVDCKILEIRIIDFPSCSFSGTGIHLERVAHNCLLSEYGLCEHLEGRDEGFIIIVHFPSCIRRARLTADLILSI